MTKIEMLNAVAADERLSAEVRETAADMAEKLTAANARKATKAAEARAVKAQEEAPLYAQAREMLNQSSTEAPLIAAVVAEALGVSSSKASVILRSFVKEGVAVSADIKVKGEKGTRTCKGYFLA